MKHPRLVAVLVWLLVCLTPSLALAIDGPDPYRPGVIVRPHGEGVEVVREAVVIRCQDGRSCRFHATWTVLIREPAAPRVGTGRGTIDYLRVDGVPTAVVEEEGTLDSPCWVPGPRGHLCGGEDSIVLRLEPLRKGRHRVELEGRLTPSPSSLGGDWSAAETRHAVLMGRRATSAIAVIGGDAPAEQDVSVEMRRGVWRPRVYQDWGVVQRGGSYRLVQEGPPRAKLWALFQNRGRHVGGPLVAAGAGFTGETRFRLRAGYELASLPFLLHGLTFETDFERSLLVPATDIGTDTVPLLPSAGLGLGVPLQVAPTARVGARTQAMLSWPVFSIVGHFDVFPAMGGEDLELHGGLYGQFSI